MKYLSNAWNMIDNYLLARWQRRPSTASFWYLREPPNVTNQKDLSCYKEVKKSPFYLIDYRQKLQYSLKNKDGIIVLPYQKPIGCQINPEAAFQYALGLHDQYYFTENPIYLQAFNQYANYFIKQQTKDGLWPYQFDWYGSKAPWYSALSQSRGASVMLRAWKQNENTEYKSAAINAFMKFEQFTSDGGFLHVFSEKECIYFEEYPNTPTGVINGFMACLIGVWELKYWIKHALFDHLWETGIRSLETMLPYYSNGWWSLYDLDKNTPIANVNSPRYHLLEIHYLQILSLLSASPILFQAYQHRLNQYKRIFNHIKALSLKCVRKIRYK